MRFFALLLLLSACSSLPTHRALSSATGQDALELALYREGVDAFVAEREARRPLISHEKHLPVVEVTGHPTEYVVVLLHGLFESPFYVKGLRRNFEARGYNVVAPTLAKHWAVPLQDLDKADYHEWIEQTVRDVRLAHKLGHKVILAGHSTGGLLALYVAIVYPELVDGLLLWSPAVALSYPTYFGAFVGAASNGLVELNYNKLAKKPPPDPEHVPYYSPFAGREVVRLQEAMLLDYNESHPFLDRPFWSDKRSMYAAVLVPVFLMNPEIDKVIYRPEINLFWDSLNVPRVRYDLPGEDHTSTPKDQDDYYPGAQSPNKDFPGMIEKLNKFLDEQFPSGG